MALESKARAFRPGQGGTRQNVRQKARDPLGCSLSGLDTAQLRGGFGPKPGQKFGSTHCSSGLSLLQAKLASAANPLNNFQLLSKSTRLLNCKSLS